MFMCRRVLDEAWLEVNTFLPHPARGRPTSNSQASTHGTGQEHGLQVPPRHR